MPSFFTDSSILIAFFCSPCLVWKVDWEKFFAVFSVLNSILFLVAHFGSRKTLFQMNLQFLRVFFGKLFCWKSQHWICSKIEQVLGEREMDFFGKDSFAYLCKMRKRSLKSNFHASFKNFSAHLIDNHRPIFVLQHKRVLKIQLRTSRFASKFNVNPLKFIL